MKACHLLDAPWRDAPPHQPMGWRYAAPSSAVSWSEFHGRIGAWQQTLDAIGAPGQCWLLYHREPLEFAAALIALWERGDRVVLPADDRPETLARLDQLTRARLGEGADARHAGAPAPPRWGEIGAQRVAVSLYTSGSTGEPQRLDKTFAQLAAELATHARLWPLAGRLVISQVSHQHIYGLLFAVLRPLCERAVIATPTCRYPETLSAWLQRLAEDPAPSGWPRQAVLVSAPPPLERLPAGLDWQAAPARLAQIYSSGAPLTNAASVHVRHVLGVGVSEIYGSSETGGIAWRDQQLGETWTPLPGIEVRSDANGQLWLRSPYLATADWEAQADRIEQMAHGFRLLGRADRIAKIGGKRLSLTGLDRALEAQAEVLRARTVVLPNHNGRLGAIVQLAPERLPQHHDARKARIRTLRERLLAAYEPTLIPRYWRFVATWPTNTQGKLSAAIVARLFQDLDDRRLPRWLGVDFPGEGQCRVTLEVPDHLAYLQGHFDARPVVPGVVMVQWAIALAREHLMLAGPLQRLERVKFPQLLLPGERAWLSLTLAPASHGSRLAFALHSQRGCHATGKALFITPEAHDVD